MLVTYKGRHTEGVSVVVNHDDPDADTYEVFIEHGGSAELPHAVGRRLIKEQPDAFSSPDEARRKRKAKATIAANAAADEVDEAAPAATPTTPPEEE